jgi:hypothetical protein
VLTFWPYVWQLDPGHTYDEHLVLALKTGCDICLHTNLPPAFRSLLLPLFTGEHLHLSLSTMTTLEKSTTVSPSTCSNRPRAKPPTDDFGQVLFPAAGFLCKSLSSTVVLWPRMTRRGTKRPLRPSSATSSPSATICRGCHRWLPHHRPPPLVSVCPFNTPDRVPLHPGYLAGNTLPSLSPPTGWNWLRGGGDVPYFGSQAERPYGLGRAPPQWSSLVAQCNFLISFRFNSNSIQIELKSWKFIETWLYSNKL